MKIETRPVFELLSREVWYRVEYQGREYQVHERVGRDELLDDFDIEAEDGDEVTDEVYEAIEQAFRDRS